MSNSRVTSARGTVLTLGALCAILGPVIGAMAQDELAHRSARLALMAVPHFDEVSELAGVAHVYDGEWEFFVGGGGAAFDCNKDHMPDIALAGGENPVGLYINSGNAGGPLAFEQADVGLDDGQSRDVLGIYALDIDGDHLDDLVLLRLGENLVLRGLGACQFEVANETWQIDGGADWTTAFAAIWEAGAQFPSLAFGNYVDRDAPGSPWGTCADNYLMRPHTGEVPNYSASEALSPGYCALSMLFTDWDGSGQASLRITNDRQYYRGGEEQMWRVAPDARPELFGREDGWELLKIWGMGIAAADLDGDGLPEYALTSMGDTKLQVLEVMRGELDPAYVDVAYALGATAHRPYTGSNRLPSTGWHAEFADFNNDGRQDLFLAKGNVEVMSDFAEFDPDNLLLQTIDADFVEAGDVAGIALDRAGRGGIIEDFNRDGMLDLLVINRRENVSLLQNLGRETDWGHASLGNWVDIELIDDHGNSAAIGARLLVKTGTVSMNRTIGVGGGHASGRVGPVHVGLGLLDRATVRVQWPDGSWSHDYRFLANQHIIIRRGAPVVAYQLIE